MNHTETHQVTTKQKKRASVPKYPWQRFKPWRKVTPEEWYDWRWQYQHLITTPEALVEIFPEFANEVEDIRSTLEKYKFTSTPYYLSLIDPSNPEDPIKLQAVPSKLEMTINPDIDLRDPLAEDRDMAVPGLVHRYPDRVLFLITEICSVYCRFCTRRRVILEKESHIDRQIQMGIDYIKNHPEIRDIIISGGDALVVGEKLLEQVLSQLRAIPHVLVIRIGSRIPVVCPMRITDSLVALLKKYQPIYFMTHFNHPYEITDDAKKACARLIDNGIPVLNQTVLLRKINSCPIIMKKLCYDLISMRVKPYYLYQCDLSEGISHFRTPVANGLEIMDSLRGYISGLAVPTYVIDAPDGGGKVPLNPNYLISHRDHQVTVRNFRGNVAVYTDPQDQDCRCSTTEPITKDLGSPPAK